MKTLTYNFFLFEVDTNSRYKLASERIICIAMLKKKISKLNRILR